MLIVSGLYNYIQLINFIVFFLFYNRKETHAILEAWGREVDEEERKRSRGRTGYKLLQLIT